MFASRFKVCRQILENVWQTKKLTLKQKFLISELQKQKKNKKQSDFSIQLQTIKKLSLFYGNLPIKKMQRAKTHTYIDKKNSLLFNIEKRLDVILVRLNFCSTMFQARQLISHKNICVNYKKVNIPGFQVSNGDLISIQENSLDFFKSNIRKNFQTNRIRRMKPNHLEVNYKTLKAVVLYEPQQIQFPYKIDLDLLD
uniref:Small ribosomal subunit protein uS4m n=1 Tax=Marchantia polymorpha TaxID=3197 RepID=RT04_MARPO|nr:ribosomal protein S4 [Marchantia paleacea]P26866.2 RecName: Full=Small ribosomal subunit protein uS4m; AltName: Full=Ribosomal protein S4, mitochondrial [Marchantia polymorpha]AAB22414.1 ribosomal protein S4 [Marchantia polymorpha=liverwort, Peptide Mitochondrial, 196 aa] [Marchantia polymorpha]AAC09458.1 rps4 [Marchantia paleacea]